MHSRTPARPAGPLPYALPNQTKPKKIEGVDPIIIITSLFIQFSRKQTIYYVYIMEFLIFVPKRSRKPQKTSEKKVPIFNKLTCARKKEFFEKNETKKYKKHRQS